MTFKDVYTELLDLSDESGLAKAAYAKRAVNRAIRWLLLQKDFLYNEAVEIVDVVSGSTSITLPEDCYKVSSISFANSMVPLPIVSYDARQTHAKNFSKTRYEPYYENVVKDIETLTLIQTGNTFLFYPAPTSNIQLSVFYQKSFTDLVDDTDTHFLLDMFSDLVILKALFSAYRARLKPEVAEAYTDTMYLSELDALLTWDTNLRSRQANILMD